MKIKEIKVNGSFGVKVSADWQAYDFHNSVSLTCDVGPDDDVDAITNDLFDRASQSVQDRVYREMETLYQSDEDFKTVFDARVALLATVKKNLNAEN